MTAEKIQTLERAVKILDCFNVNEPELGVREIARRIHLSSSTTGRLMAAMKELNILAQNTETHLYCLGSKILALSAIYTSTMDVRNLALAKMVSLHELTQETISLYIMEGNERICIERLESPQTVRIVTWIGRRIPLYAGSAGKCFLAFLPVMRREEILNSTKLEALTENTIINLAELRSELEHIRNEGCAVSIGEWVLEAAGVAAPIFNAFGQIIAVLTISGPASRFSKEKIEQYKLLIMEKAAQISKEFGFTTSKN